MIKKFSKINYGSYQDFSWDNLQEFQKLNIFYGRNYSGKTTLSRILRSFEVKNPHSDYVGSTFQIEIKENAPPLTQDDIANNDLVIRVYNKDFVKENLGFLIDDKAGDIKAFASVIVGEENKKTQAKIQELQNKLGNEKENKENNIFVSGLYKELQDLNKEKADTLDKIKTKNQDEKLSKKASQIKSNSNFVIQGTNYDIRNIRKDIETIKTPNSNFILESHEKQTKEALISDEIKQSLDFEISFNVNRFSEFITKSRILIETKITPKQNIENQLRSWLDEGLKLHEHSKDTQQCKFCNNTLTQERIQWLLENVKDDKTDLMKSEINAYLEEIKGMEKDSEKVLEKVQKIESQSFYKNLREDFNQYKTNLESAIRSYNNSSLRQLRQNLEDKLKGIYNPNIIFHEVTDNSREIQQILNSIKDLCTQNNKQTKTLEQDQENARKALRLDEVARFIDNIDYFKTQEEIKELENTLKIKDKEIKDKEQEIEKIKKEIQELQDSLSDEKTGADKANEYLKSFFGNNQLEFKSIPEKKGEFKIHRNNEAAKNLSEGECSLLAFCYFVAKLQDRATKDKKPIIWIDDPISSLDSNHIFFIFSLIESQIAKPKNYTQLFISTHNLDFLRYLKSLTDFQWRDNKKTPMFLIEKQQSSTIKELPLHIKKYITEFNYLFKKILECAESKVVSDITLDAYYNVANNIRKFLDYYLFFKYPSNENLIEKYKYFFKDYQKASFVNRIINEFSHLEETTIRATMPIDLQEIQEVAKMVIERLKDDKEQFNALLKSIGKGEDINNDK
ncbi:AAA family ATPase [Helicobacter ganmani]|uniref:RloC protein n=1 Tax=Helicobacter ganmani TaxID=60246 RepID=A0A3D8IH43_9HELI|nr:AAA family ATPase [Helicobacter ganmani]RDU64438.1 RloC protein [Helicobacter ganmani]